MYMLYLNPCNLLVGTCALSRSHQMRTFRKFLLAEVAFPLTPMGQYVCRYPPNKNSIQIAAQTEKGPFYFVRLGLVVEEPSAHQIKDYNGYHHNNIA